MASTGTAVNLIDETGITLHISSLENRQKEIEEREKHLADELLKTALQHRVQLRNDPLLVEALAHHNVSESVPHELYRAVAEILTFLQRLEKAGP